MSTKYRVRLARRAENDIRGHHDYIALHRPRTAAKWYREIKNKIQSLRSFPFRCEIAPEAEETEVDFRHLLFGNYRIIFRVEGDQVQVARVIHAARLLNPRELLPPHSE